MIIRLTGADFSQNKLGTIQIKRELTAETLTLLTNYSKTLTDTQKFALQDFIDGLKSANIWSAIGNLYLPILAGSLGESLFNVKTNVKDNTPIVTSYELTSVGLKSIGTSTTDISAVNYNGSQQNLHLLAYNTETYTTLSQSEILFGNTASQLIQTVINTSFGFDIKTDGNTVVNVTAGAVKQTPGLKGIVQSTLGNIAVGRTSDTIYSTPISTDNTYTNFPVGLLAMKNMVARANNAHYGLITMGTSLTLTQVETYKTLADTFMVSMGISLT